MTEGEVNPTSQMLIEAAQCIENPEAFDRRLLCRLLYNRAALLREIGS